jgi:hypothetical protein
MSIKHLRVVPQKVIFIIFYFDRDIIKALIIYELIKN